MLNPQRVVTPSSLEYSLRPTWPQGVTTDSEVASEVWLAPLSYVGNLFSERSVPFSWRSHNWLDIIWKRNGQPSTLGLAGHGWDLGAEKRKDKCRQQLFLYDGFCSNIILSLKLYLYRAWSPLPCLFLISSILYPYPMMLNWNCTLGWGGSHGGAIRGSSTPLWGRGRKAEACSFLQRDPAV